MKRLRVTVDGKVFDVAVEVLDEGTAPAAAVAPAPVAQQVTAAPAPVAAPVARAAAPAPAAASNAPAGPGDVRSQLAGRVVSVDVQLGQEVKEGQTLLTLEAMKMNTLVAAPKSGKVAEIAVNAGDAVDEGQILIRLT